MQRGRVGAHRAQVGEQAQRLADGQQALFRAHLGVGVGPLGPADSAEQHGVGFAAGFERGGRQWLAMLVDGDAADVVFGESEVMAEARGDGLEHVHRGDGDLGADAVTRQYDDVGLHGGSGCPVAVVRPGTRGGGCGR